MEWYSNKITLPGPYCHSLNTKNNFIHFIGCNENDYHLKIHIYDIIPTELFRDYKKRKSNKFNKSVFGYLNETENDLKLYLAHIVICLFFFFAYCDFFFFFHFAYCGFFVFVYCKFCFLINHFL